MAQNSNSRQEHKEKKARNTFRAFRTKTILFFVTLWRLLRRYLTSLIGIALAAIFLYLFLRNIDIHEVWKHIRQGNPHWLILSMALILLNYFMRALRWRYFFLPIKKTRIWNLYITTVIGFAANTIFPLKIGEVVRPILLGRKENIGRSAALATVVIERLFDTLSVLLMLVVYLLVLVRPEQLSTEASASLGKLKVYGMMFFAGVIAIVIFLYYLKTKPTLIRAIVGRVESFLPGKISHSLDGILDSFIEGLSILHDPKLLLKIGCWSIAFWLLISAGFWAGVRAYVPDFPFTGTFLVMILLAIGIAVPTPGAVGSYHLACKIGLSRFFGVPETRAIAIALISHFITFVPVTILGVAFLWHEGLTAAKLKKIAENSASEKGAVPTAETSGPQTTG